MSQRKKDVVGSEYLDEVWHATGKAPRRFPGDKTYVFGLDVLGAAGLAPLRPSGTPAPAAIADPPAVNTAAAEAAAARAISVAAKLASKRPGAAAKLARVGKKTNDKVAKVKNARAAAAKAAADARKAAQDAASLQKLRDAATDRLKQIAPAQAGVLTKAPDPSGAAAGTVAKAIATSVPVQTTAPLTASAPTASTAAKIATSVPVQPAPLPKITTTYKPPTTTSLRTRLYGDGLAQHIDDGSAGPGSLTMQALDPAILRAAIDEMTLGARLADAAAQAGTIEDAIITLGNTLPPEATTVMQAGQALVDRCDAVLTGADNGDASVIDRVPQIKTDADAWSQQAQAAMQGILPPGQTGQSPFDPGQAGGGAGGASDSGESGDAGGGAADAGGGYADGGGGGGGDEGFDTGESEAVRQFRESGGEADPFEEGSDAEAAEDDGGLPSSDEDAEADPFAEDAADETEDLLGVDFQWTDIFFPWQAAQRKDAEDAEKRAIAAPFSNTQDAVTTQRLIEQGVSPAVAAKLAAARKKLAAAQARKAQADALRLQAMRAQRALIVPDDQAARAMLEDDHHEESVMGLEWDELDDIVTHDHQYQITDEPPDLERRRGSVHRGAAYLQPETYPPGGASSGQEGGEVMPEEKVMVFGSHSMGCDVLGAQLTKKALVAQKTAAGPRAGFIKKTTPAGRKITALVVVNPKAHNHKSSIANARDAGKRAVSMAGKLKTAAGKKAAKARGTAVHGLIASHHVAKMAAKGHYAKMSPAQLLKLAADVASQGKSTLASADKHEKYIGGLKAKDTAAISAQRRTYGPSGKKGTRVLGCVDTDNTLDVLGAACESMACEPMEEVLGELAADVMIHGDIDVFGDDPMPTGPMDDGSTSDEGYVPDASVSGPPDYGMGTPPTVAPPLVEGQDYISGRSYPIDQPLAFQGDLPVGAVIYDKSMKPLPWQGVGSFTRFNPSSDNADGKGESGFQWGGGDPSIMDGWYWWWHGATHGTEYKHENAGNSLDNGYGSGNETMPRRQQESVNRGWGPLIGNPNGWTHGLRYDSTGDRWFWFYDEAPDFARGPLDQARLNQAILDYRAQVTAAAADAAAQAAQDQLDAEAAAQQAKQQAAEDLQTAHAQDQEMQQAQHEQQIQQMADETAATQQQQADDSYARQQAADTQATTEAWRTQELTEADIEQKALETEARLDAMAPPADEEAEEEPDSGLSADEAMDAEEGLTPDEASLEEVLGMLRGTQKMRLKRATRY